MVHLAANVPSYIKTLAPLIIHYGYFAVAGMLFLEDFGVLVPGETVLIAAAFYAGLGQLNIIFVILVGFIAAVLGDNVGFAIGDFGGRPLILKFGRYVRLKKEHLDKAEHYFNRHGGKIVAIARFIDGLRQLNGLVAGISDMRWLKFLVFNVIGAFLWVVFWSLIGYYGGSHLSAFLHVELYITIAFILLVAGRIVYKRYFKATKTAAGHKQ
jgi:membrane protein DedA with SNARE-associated domain